MSKVKIRLWSMDDDDEPILEFWVDSSGNLEEIDGPGNGPWLEGRGISVEVDGVEKDDEDWRYDL